MRHFLLIYDLAPDFLARRPHFRDTHLALAQEAGDRGELLAGGALTDPADRAMLLFAGDGPAAAEAFAEADPYVREGLVENWRVREWVTVAGPLAAAPIDAHGQPIGGL